MSLIQHAQTELEIAGLFSEENDFYGGMTGKAVMELIEKFSEQGHSGMSAPIVADLFKKLANYEPLGPITGKDEEWTFLDYGDNLQYQNKRESGLFKDKEGKVTYNSAIVKRCENGTCWSGPLWLSKEDYLTGNKDLRIYSSQEIKGFPFTPKTFYIDVIEEEVAPDDWEMWVKDPKQLEEVWGYYKKPY